MDTLIVDIFIVGGGKVRIYTTMDRTMTYLLGNSDDVDYFIVRGVKDGEKETL